MTEKEYRQSEGISRSELWLLNPDNGGTPEKFKWAREHPEKPTPALIFGTLVHCLLLEPDSFNKQFAVWDDTIKKTTKEGKAAYAEFTDDLMGRQEVSRTMYEQATVMALLARSTPFVGKLLVGEHEKPIKWTDEMTGEICKIRLDCLTEIGGKPVIVDYKTTADASTDGFMRSAINYGYDFQAGMYCEGVEKVTGQKPLFVFVAQEKTPPYAVNILQADNLMVQRGYDIFRELIGIYHECKITDNWYGYLGAYNVINNLSLPAWLAKEVE